MTYHTQIRDYLTDTYGVTDAEITHRGGSHPKLIFTYADKRFSATLQRDCPDNPNLVHMKQQDLRRLLGTPPDESEINPQPEKRTLKKMTAQLQASAASMQAKTDMTPHALILEHNKPSTAQPLMGQMCRYKDRLKFVFPEKITPALKGHAVFIERLSPDSWKLSRHPNLARREPMIHWHKSQWEIEPSRPLALYEDLQVFGPSPAEYLLVDGVVMVRLLIDQLKPLGMGKGHRRPTTAAPPKPPFAPEPVIKASVDELVGLPLEAMHACLAEIRRIERLSLYRLIKIAGKDGAVERWVFRAPLIE